jgi:hypothetical protein
MKIRDFNLRITHRLNPAYFVLLIFITPAVLLLLDLSIDDLNYPLANGDLLNTYKMQETFWKFRSFTNTNSGYPAGLDTRVWPYLDPLPSALTGLFYFATSNVILSVNLVFISSFSVCAIVVWVITTEIGISKVWRALIVLMCLTLPWIPGRIEHFDFTFISMVLLPLYFYIKIGATKRDFILISLTGISCGLINPYFAVFASLNLFFAIVHNLLTSGFGKKTILLITGIASSFIGMILSLSISTFGFNGQVFPGFRRSLSESVNLAGYLFVLLSPVEGTESGPITKVLPSSDLLGVGKEPTMKSNFGSWLVLAAFTMIIVLVCQIYMSKLKFDQPEMQMKENRKQRLYLFLILICGNTLFFLKGGFGILLSFGGLSFIRSWNRLTPIIQILLIITAVYFIQNWTNYGKKWWFKITVGLLIFSQLQAFTSLSPAPKKQQQKLAQNYVDEISAVIKSPCGILQLPLISYPQNGNLFRMHDYDPFILQLTYNKFQWSYGNPKNQNEEVESKFDIKNEQSLRTLGFCGISLDNFGTNSKDTLNSLIETYGPSEVQSSNGRYQFFLISRTP